MLVLKRPMHHGLVSNKLLKSRIWLQRSKSHQFLRWLLSSPKESWMKEDLFVRPDGQPMIFLMGDVRERDQVDKLLYSSGWMIVKGEGTD